MKTFFSFSNALKALSVTLIAGGVSSAYANYFDYTLMNTRQQLACYTLDCPHWYVAGNLGMSHLFDEKSPGSRDSMNENGPGWDATVGYQVNSLFGGELGYTQYHDSRETLGSAHIAKTEHYAVHLNASGRYPLYCQFSLLGKLGVAYSYANKVFTAATTANSSNALSAYYGLGAAYSVTRCVDFTALWARVRGNNYTGSSDLISAGITFAIA